MNRKRSIILERREKLMDLIVQAKNNHLNVEYAAEKLGISPVTLRRDLCLLEEEGLIRRAYGKVTLMAWNKGTENLMSDAGTEKIAKAAAESVNARDVIFINAGRIGLQMLRLIAVPNVTVITNHVLAVNTPHRSDMTLILTGGEIHLPEQALVGDVAQRSIQTVHAEKAFLCCSGVSAERGITTAYYAEAAINSLMLSCCSGQSYLLVPHDRLEKSDHFCCGELRQIHELITDRKADPTALKSLQETGLQIRLA